MQNGEKINNFFKTEVVEIILPSNTNTNHIFNEDKFEILPTYDADKNKIIILKEKNDK